MDAQVARMVLSGDTAALAEAAGGDWSFNSGSAWQAAGGIAQKGSNRVVATIERSDGAIGYVEASYARFHKAGAPELVKSFLTTAT